MSERSRESKEFYSLKADYGLKVLIFPSLQYIKDDEVDALRKMYDIITEYSDEFIIFSDVNIYGKNVHPVFKHLIKWSKGLCGSFMKWDFPKFIINDKGNLVKVYEPGDRFEVNNPIIKKLLKNKKCVKRQLKIVRYERNPYDIEDSEEEIYY
ncbi:glutathione peroxidase [Vairimorpha apis BRL 01]|uniref:Glutathione peroxidase n=1 Tax=Vairimorpha apis BRL 01 TaxID=1037528 RepID=T0L3Y5_9MICR|nr:glutathione peroxidase [Vairimorpha apis BRL 01]